MDGDAEALVERLFGGDAQDARELVPERTAAIGLEVGGRQRQADALARQERPERRLFAWGDRLRADSLEAIGRVVAGVRAAHSVRVSGAGGADQRLVEHR